jgi:Domain of unknown function (DUF4157)
VLAYAALIDTPEPAIRRIPSPLTRAPLHPPLLALLVAAFVATAALADEKTAQEPEPASDLNPAVVQGLTPVLADWIVRSRNAAIQEGVMEIPAAIRSALAGYVPDATLNRVRWRTGGGGGLSLQQNVFAFGETPAITLDYVIVFSDEKAALEDPKLWAHELKHVMQFADWGVMGFATHYLRDDGAVEMEAADYRWEFMKLRGLTPPPAPVR